jgi:hypothetical protein
VLQQKLLLMSQMTGMSSCAFPWLHIAHLFMLLLEKNQINNACPRSLHSSYFSGSTSFSRSFETAMVDKINQRFSDMY